MKDHRITPALFTDILDVLHRHGFTCGSDEHDGQAYFLIGDLTRIYEGTQDHPHERSSSRASHPSPPEPPDQGRPAAVIVPPGGLMTVVAALGIAADYKRDRAEMCADCSDQSCTACQSRLRDAQAYDQMTGNILQAAEDALAARFSQTKPARRARQPRLADGKEAGQ